MDADHYRPSGDRRFDAPTLLYLGRLKRYKRVDLILDAVAKLRSEGLGLRLLVAGEGDDGPKLQRHAAGLGLGQDSVGFLGRVSEDDKLRLLQGAWVHVLTSAKEGWGDHQSGGRGLRNALRRE